MKMKDIEDCSECPLKDECSGGAVTPNGFVEPECASWSDEVREMTLEEFEGYHLGVEAIRIEEKEVEQERIEALARKKELANKRRKEAKWHVWREDKLLKSLRKKLGAELSIQSLSRSLTITTSIFNCEDVKMDREDNVRIKNLRKKIAEVENIKKQKLKELRHSRRKNDN